MKTPVTTSTPLKHSTKIDAAELIGSVKKSEKKNMQIDNFLIFFQPKL